jgi:hypothetical protein
MITFFSRFKDHLSMDFGGRYFEVILHEVIKEDLDIIKILFPSIDRKLLLNKDDIEIEVEDVFHAKNKKNRRADLVVKHNGKHIALLEIKYLDGPLEGQIDDYINYAKENNIYFTYLTQNIPSGKDIIKITSAYNNKFYHLLYRDLYKSLLKLHNKNNPILKLFCNYLEENFMVYNNEINENALILLMLKGLFVRHDHGFGRKVSAENINSIPALWNTLISNLSIIGDRFYSDFDFFNNRFNIDFGFDPSYDINKIKNDLNKTQATKNSNIKNTYKSGGEFFIITRGKFQSKKSDLWMHVAMGYVFYLDLNRKQMRKSLYTYIDSVFYKGHDLVKDIDRKFLRFPREEECYNSLLKMMVDNIDNIISAKIKNPFNKKLIELKKEIIRKIE